MAEDSVDRDLGIAVELERTRYTSPMLDLLYDNGAMV